MNLCFLSNKNRAMHLRSISRSCLKVFGGCLHNGFLEFTDPRRKVTGCFILHLALLNLYAIWCRVQTHVSLSADCTVSLWVTSHAQTFPNRGVSDLTIQTVKTATIIRIAVRETYVSQQSLMGTQLKTPPATPRTFLCVTWYRGI